MKDLIIEPTISSVNEMHRYVENAQDLLIDKGRLNYETQLQDSPS